MSEITSEILAAFDEIKDEPEEEIEPSPAHEDVPVTEPEEEEEEQEEEEEEEIEEEEDLVGEEEEQSEEEVAAFDDPAIQSFLAKYGGDVEKALRGAVELSVVLGRQGSEKSAALARVQELEQELQQMQALSGLEETYLSEEQNQWVEEAIASQNPRGYVHSAMQAGEYDLARAVVREWSRESPYEAMRAGQFVDQAQQQAMQQYQPVEEPIDQGLLLNLLAQNYPDMTGYWGQMETMLHQLGPDHPTVIDARGNDVERSARAIINLYEIARASTASVQSAKDEIKQKRRRAANDARNGAVVSSGAASRTTETPRRSIMVTPGLTLEQLDAEFEAASK